MKLLLVVFILFFTGSFPGGFSTDTCNGEADIGKLRLTWPKRNINDGAVLICNRYSFFFRYIYTWDYVTTNAWTDTTAQVACRQLGLPHLTAQSFSVQLPFNEHRVTGLRECNECDGHLYQCLPQTSGGWSRERSRDVAALSCYCHEGTLRLGGGSTYREGRVEVCVDGRWGTVCNQSEWTPEVAGLVCSELGFSKHNATFHGFGGGFGPVYSYTCSSMDTGNPNCTIDTPSECEDHSMDAGVRCQPLESACGAIINNELIIENTTDIVPGPNTTSTTSSLTASTPTITTSLLTDSTFSTGETDAQNAAALRSTNEALGALTGLLAAALVAVTMGWIVSCIYWWRRISQRDHTHKDATNAEHSIGQHHLHNPMYDVSAGTHSQTNYSSLGPAYDHVQANQGTSYDVINRRGAPRPHPPRTQPISHDPTSEQDYSVLEENNYHVLEPSTVAGEEHSVKRSNVTMTQGGAGRIQQEPPNEQDPQDYEIPNPLN